MAESIDELFDCFTESYKNEDPKEMVEISNKMDSHDSDEMKGTKRQNEGCSYQEVKKIKDDIEIDINCEEFQNRIVVHSIETGGECTHEVAYPPGQEYFPLTAREGEPAKGYKFTLDPFQKESILCVDNNQSVLVSAHTSAGKTVIAEYAVAKSLAAKQRVIYTTPIKALSNQKYREFLDEFRDVGLVTGDVTINPSASCLIMTTEILRNMLYRGSEIMREVGWVVFDEIHYMRDKERGVVWEETLILLPHNVHFVFLSATIPNARQFVEWVAHLHQQPCHVVYTDYRPTPLQHFIYPAGGNGIHMVVNEMGEFKDDSYNKAMASLQGDSAKGDTRGRRGGISNKTDPASTDIFKVIKMIMERDFAPVIVFSFSKKDCELYGTLMTKLDFNTSAEKKMVDEIFANATDILTEEDKLLPQVQNILPLLRRGIGIHHGGLLPILKEVIEILFGEGLIKTLFATETFAMGLNMPARTVLFTGVRKFDGQSYRWISSGEYIQMSGRAGRRGIDDKGIVILMVDEKLPPAIGRDIVKGLPDPINSAFHLTYNMVLNLLRVEEINPEYMLERSFFQFQNQTNIPILYSTYMEKLKEYNEFSIEEEDQVASYYSIKQELEKLGVLFRGYITKPEYFVGFLQPGRLIKIKIEEADYDWGVIINFKKSPAFTSGRSRIKTKSKLKVQLDVLLHIIPEQTDMDNIVPKPCGENETGEIEIVSVDSQYVTHISSVRLLCPADLTLKDSRKNLYKTVKEAKKRFSGELPLLDPVNDMKIQEKPFLDILNKMKVLEKKLNEHVLCNSKLLETQYEEYEKKITCLNALESAKKALLNAQSILQLDELKSRKRVLRRLGYCLDADVIQLKGRVACELSSADELLITEMIFNGIFGTLTPEQSCALLSCFVCDEKLTGDSPGVCEELSGPLKQMQDLARRIAKVSIEARLPFDEATYLEQFKPSLMDVVFHWCKGSSFSDLCKMTDIFEGSIVRCMRRLEELLRQMVQASKTIGNVELEHKFNDAIKVIKRDIVFSSSLYL